MFGVEIKIIPDREDAVYQVGETAGMTVVLTEHGQPLKNGRFAYRITRDGGEKIADGMIDAAVANPTLIPVSLDRPGFAGLRVDIPEKERTGKYPVTALPFLGAVAFDPEKIVSKADYPADFRKFWEDGRACLADRPVTLVEMPGKSTPNAKAYRITVDSQNGPLYGFLAMPNGDGPFAAVVTVPGAGAGAPGPGMKYAERGIISLTMNVHQYEFPDDPDEGRRIFAEQKKKFYYPVKDSADRDRYFFRRVILGVDRAVNYVAALPQWDGRNFIADGTSQGGGMALIIAGFNPHISACAANVPAMCDHQAARDGRQNGWPGLIGNNPAAEKVAPYYDVVNFARDIKCPVLMSVGFIDSTCSPGGVYAAYNQILASKEMFRMPGEGHALTDAYMVAKERWIERRLGR